MKAHLFFLAALCVAPAPWAVPSEDQSPAKTDGASTQATPASELKSADIAKAPADSQVSDLAKRIQAVTNSKSRVVVEIAKMADAGIESSVIEAYAQTANVPTLKPDEILFLHDHGVSAEVITTLIKRSGQIMTQQAQAQKEAQERFAQQQANQSATLVPQRSVPPTATAPATFNYYVTPPPTYTYGYPIYTYPPYPAYGYSYPRPYSSYYSPIYSPSYANRFSNFYVSHHPNASLSVGIHTPRPESFYMSRWMWNGTTGKPVDLVR